MYFSNTGILFVYLDMRKFYYTFLLFFFTLVGLLAQEVQILGVKSALAKEDKFNHLQVYLTCGAPSMLKVKADASCQWLVYEQDPQKAVLLNSAVYNSSEQLWLIPQPKVNQTYLIRQAEQLDNYLILLNYLDYSLDISDLVVQAVQQDPFRRIVLRWQGMVRAITYYTPDGLQQKIPREAELSYDELIWNEKKQGFEQKRVTKLLDLEGEKYELTSSLAETDYTIEGDKWQKIFGLKPLNLKSNVYESKRLDVHAIIHVLNTKGEKQKSDRWMSLSAPITLSFRAEGNGGAVKRYRWRIFYQSSERSKEQALLYDSSAEGTQFDLQQAGLYTLVLDAFGSDVGNEQKGQEWIFKVRASKLEVPNAFSPFDSVGVNDLFSVSAESIIKFEAHVYAPNGQEIYSWIDVNGGWNGRYRGRKMPAGVYYYLVIAEGSDGEKYQKKGAVNLLTSYNTISETN